MSYHLFRVLLMALPVGATSGNYWQGKLESTVFQVPGTPQFSCRRFRINVLNVVKWLRCYQRKLGVLSGSLTFHLLPLFRNTEFYGVASRCGICTLLEDLEVKSQRRPHGSLLITSYSIQLYTKYKASLLGDGPSTLNVDEYCGDIGPNRGPNIKYPFFYKNWEVGRQRKETTISSTLAVTWSNLVS